jgi:hypothetical protein
MAADHLHSIRLENGKYHHLFNLDFMVESEVQILQMALNGKPIPSDKVDVLNGLKTVVDRMMGVAATKNEKAQQQIEAAANNAKEVEAEVQDKPS